MIGCGGTTRKETSTASWAQLGEHHRRRTWCGIFKERIWYPRFDEVADPDLRLIAGILPSKKRQPRTERWRGGLPLRHVRDAIFPDDVRGPFGAGAPMCIVTHEAPSCHRHGFVGIDQAAASLCRAAAGGPWSSPREL